MSTPKETVAYNEHADVDIERDSKDVAPEPVTLTQEDNDRIRHKTDKRILSILIWIYFLQILDKSVLGLGNVWGLSQDTGLKGQDYSTIASINAIAQLAWQPFSSYLLVRVPARHLMTGMVLGWGIAATCMAAAHNFGGLLATRFLLGLFEAGCLPLFGMLTAQWYRRAEQPSRVAAWYSTNGLATIFGSFLSWALGHVKNEHVKAWQLIFIIVGVITVLSAPLVWFVLDSDIESARFLDEREKAQAYERLRANNTGTGSHEYKFSQVWEMFYDPKSWLWLFMSLLLNIGASVSNAFGPTLIAGFGFDKGTTSLLNIPFGALQFIAIIAASYAAQVWRLKGAVLAIFVIPVIIGLALLYTQSTSTGFKQAPALVGFYLISALYGGNPLIVTWMAANTAGQTKKSTIMSLYNAGSAAGNIIGPYLFQSKDKPQYRPGVKIVMGMFCALLAVIGLQVIVLGFLNKQRQRQRVANGKPEFIKDTSMSSKWEAQEEVQEEGAGVRLGQNALLDLTDFENDEMVYVY
ncbi:hypothetical protein CcaverHIS002_0108380 [Cutaneotrichosporon cavernicola]|uniref:Major facilitator superfamily (MFS) profile domain-containing protein n=1 Tax=Cutaneotrichosporon cavernicola TaxID=279322 RepID=A0AA48II19_9TREE|nr:uncharacterized protein CcaverHIS019_0108310 [Cutaneotrichosporon cavernicola]BEI80309.1 hypothetical protein CcaverHIS002_0108380 [Cutaneotrichosporon cavernicola]BEI88113.1 hypothetical protein CcaverHIS019_0108310 [Cutaneotrichosporon cavernicola]BEI95884.1 hypothetical protein CcaverHIS631_0108330 [Cutaneotrichosporon cavernicola]BEJ03658.1 hypothetical protein CcaverHIS641_0108330 [Cutaneotrichosporon cavernicola]